MKQASAGAGAASEVKAETNDGTEVVAGFGQAESGQASRAGVTRACRGASRAGHGPGRVGQAGPVYSLVDFLCERLERSRAPPQRKRIARWRSWNLFHTSVFAIVTRRQNL